MIPLQGQRVLPINPEHQDDIHELSSYHELVAEDDLYDYIDDNYRDDA